jgi:hypothetical protein
VRTSSRRSYDGINDAIRNEPQQSKYWKKIGWMFWGSIGGRYGRHRRLFWEKDWESINEGSYSGIIIPVVDEIL